MRPAHVRDGLEMVRCPDASWEPRGVEVPFFCTIHDILQRDLDIVREQAGEQHRRVESDRLSRLGRAVLGLISEVTVEFHVVMLTIPVGTVKELSQRLRELFLRRDAPLAVLDDRQAISYVLQKCVEAVSRLRDQHSDVP